MNESEAKASEVRARLRRNGRKREKLRADQDKLKDETTEVIGAAIGVVPIKEAAKLTGLNRSTVYELYMGDTNGESAAHGGASAGQRDSVTSGRSEGPVGSGAGVA